jgi:predicted DNA-binding transcriptional regulator YafY
MSRSERLLELMQLLRRHRGPVAGQTLAQELGVGMRTLYRDIAALQAQGAEIDGVAGLGYVLRPGFTLPPLMFSHEEIEALVLGARWVMRQADPRLAQATHDALAKIEAVLPPARRDDLDQAPLLVGTSTTPGQGADEAIIRDAIRAERRLRIAYADKRKAATDRVIWPFALGYFEAARVVMAWCELRQDFRHFRTDRIAAMAVQPERYPRRRASLLKAWKQAEGVDLEP